MPTYERLPSFDRDWHQLTLEQRAEFRSAVDKFVTDLRSGRFRKGLRVKGVQTQSGVFEMTWADDGRATFAYGAAVTQGEPHIIWRRIGTHDIFRTP